MKKFMVIAMVLLSLLLLASCGGGGEAPGYHPGGLPAAA